MSGKQRERAAALRAKYARTFDVSIESVRVEYLEDEDARVWSIGLPTWTLGAERPDEPERAQNPKVTTW